MLGVPHLEAIACFSPFESELADFSLTTQIIILRPLLAPPPATLAAASTNLCPGPPRPRQKPSPSCYLPSTAMSLADLIFQKGQAFEDEVWKHWGVHTNLDADENSPGFPLVVEFTRSKIRLTNESVATILLSYFGGHAFFTRLSDCRIGLLNS